MTAIPEALRKKAIAAAWAVQQIGSQEWNNYCELFAEQSYGTEKRFGSAATASTNLPLAKALKDAQPGDLVYFAADATNDNYGHVGVYVGNGEMVSATPNGVKRSKIASDPYYAPRFKGVADAPDQWQGRTETPDLVKGAEDLITRVTTGDTKMADPRVETYTKQRDDLQASVDAAQSKLDAARALIKRYESSSEKDATWLPANGVTKKQIDDAYALIGEDSDLVKRLDKDKASLRKAEADLADATAAAAKPPSASAPDPKGTKVTKVETLGDGNRYVISYVADGLGNLNVDTTTPPQPYGPQKTEKPERDTSARDAVDLETAKANLATAQQRLQEATSPQAKERAQLELDTAKLNLERAQRDLNKPTTTSYGGRSYPIDPNTGLPDTSKAVDLMTPEERAAATEAGQLDLQGKRNALQPKLSHPVDIYNQEAQKRQQLANAEKDRLLGLQNSGALSHDEAEQRFQSWWQQNVEAPLAPIRAAAERQQAMDQMQLDAAQRQEDERAAAINREREKYAYGQGQTVRDKAAALIPNVRSASFLAKEAGIANGYLDPKAPPVQFSAADFQPDPGQVPDLNAMADMETARALAHISPAAAAKIGAPLPQFPAAPDLNSYLAPFRLPTPAPVPAPEEAMAG